MGASANWKLCADQRQCKHLTHVEKAPGLAFLRGIILASYFLSFIRIIDNLTDQLGAGANFDNLVKFGDRRQIRWSQMFIKLAFEFGCDVILMSHPITR